jgi:glycerol-1-phosphate dehydrogenase [NAD(P)+]
VTVSDDPLARLLAGSFIDPETGSRFACPVGKVVMANSLDGREAELVAGLGRRLAVVADECTWEAMGQRIARALRPHQEVVLRQPYADAETVDEIRRRAGAVDALVAVGSGTINDLCKAAAEKDRRRYAVFATAPSMNGYVTGTASITVKGLKLSLTARPPCGAFFDLEVLAAAPARLIQAGIGDCLARSTAQVDWLLASLLFGSAYSDTPFVIQAEDEPLLLDRAADAVAGDIGAVEVLVRVLLLSGLGMALVGSSHPASMGEHLISHYVDMLALPHPRSLHGEQVAVASWSLARLQAQILAAATPPVLMPTRIDEEAMRARYGPAADDCIRSLKRKALDQAACDPLNSRVASDWPRLRAKLRAATLPLPRLERAMRAARLPMTGEALGLDAGFYGSAVLYARELRDRFGMLDLADDAGLLEEFAVGER